MSKYLIEKGVSFSPNNFVYIKVNYAINRIHEKAFTSDLSIEMKKTSPLMNYFLGITFFCYLSVHGSFVRFLLRIFSLGNGVNQT